MAVKESTSSELGQISGTSEGFEYAGTETFLDGHAGSTRHLGKSGCLCTVQPAVTEAAGPL